MAFLSQQGANDYAPSELSDASMTAIRHALNDELESRFPGVADTDYRLRLLALRLYALEVAYEGGREDDAERDFTAERERLFRAAGWRPLPLGHNARGALTQSQMEAITQRLIDEHALLPNIHHTPPEAGGGAPPAFISYRIGVGWYVDGDYDPYPVLTPADIVGVEGQSLSAFVEVTSLPAAVGTLLNVPESDSPGWLWLMLPVSVGVITVYTINNQPQAITRVANVAAAGVEYGIWFTGSSSLSARLFGTEFAQRAIVG